jgi:hypothetical protein
LDNIRQIINTTNSTTMGSRLKQTAFLEFINGAKWQADRMYSEEDLKEAFRGGRKTSWIKTDSFEEWFEQFKKKKHDTTRNKK